MAQELYNGIAIIIDDVLKNYNDFDNYKISEEERKDDIYKIIEKIKEKNLPFLTFNNRPSKEIIENFTNISFILLDWKLYKEDTNDVLDRVNATDNADFINRIIEKCFVPIFIFSNEEPDDIIEQLKKNNLYYDEEERNFIFIKRKGALVTENGLFKLIEEWIQNHPSTYLIKTWDLSFNTAKNESFWHLYKRSPLWPQILAKACKDEQLDIAENFNDVIYRVIKSRSKLNQIDEEVFEKSVEEKFDRKEITEVIRGITYVDANFLDEDDIKVGDIFKVGGEYFLNIRPDCDLVKGRDYYDKELYLIQGDTLTENQRKKFITKKYSPKIGFYEIHDEALLLDIDNKEMVLFKFNKIYVKEVDELISNKKRLCRLLPPHSVYIQQRFNSYMGRIGIPRYPDDIIQNMLQEFSKSKEDENEKK